MKTQKGYYSLLQFCPDVSRLEAVNLGVVLFCPDTNFLEAKTSRNVRRAEKLVGRGELAREALKLAKSAIEKRLQVDRDSFKDIDDLSRFVETRGNALRLTTPRPLKIRDPADDLQQLFNELVGGKASGHTSQSKALFPQLANLFTQLSSAGKAQLDYPVKLPVLGYEFKVPFAYQNGVLNLVKPQRFSHRAPQKALDLAIRGRLIREHGLEGAGESRLVVVSRFESQCDPQFVSHVNELFEEYKLKHVRQTEIAEFAATVESEVHD